MQDDIDPRLLETDETEKLSPERQRVLLLELRNFGKRIDNIANDLIFSDALSANQIVTPALSKLEKISEIGRLVDVRARELINNFDRS